MLSGEPLKPASVPDTASINTGAGAIETALRADSSAPDVHAIVCDPVPGEALYVIPESSPPALEAIAIIVV